MSMRILPAVAALIIGGLAISGCGLRGDDGAAARSRPASYWTGKRDAFCSTPITVKEDQRGPSTRLLLQGDEVRAGSALFVRIENHDRYELLHGSEPLVDQMIKGEWKTRGFEANGRPILFDLAGRVVPRWSAGSCIEVPASTNWTPGRYRVRFEVELEEPDDGQATLYPSGYFEVVAGGIVSVVSAWSGSGGASKRQSSARLTVSQLPCQPRRLVEHVQLQRVDADGAEAGGEDVALDGGAAVEDVGADLVVVGGGSVFFAGEGAEGAGGAGQGDRGGDVELGGRLFGVAALDG